MKIIIQAGGLGTHMGFLTATKSRALISTEYVPANNDRNKPFYMLETHTYREISIYDQVKRISKAKQKQECCFEENSSLYCCVFKYIIQRVSKIRNDNFLAVSCRVFIHFIKSSQARI